MALPTLRTTGIATNLVMCLIADPDSDTVVELVNATVNAQKTVSASVQYGASTWKGSSRRYFYTQPNGTFNFHGVTFGATRPNIAFNDSDGGALFIAAAGADASGDRGHYVAHSGYGFCNRVSSRMTSDFNNAGTTTPIPSDGTTKFSMGYNHKQSDRYDYFYGLESGSLANDGGAVDGGFGSAYDVVSVGGLAGQGNWPIKAHIVALFNRSLTLLEWQSLHGDGTNDFWTTLFDAAVGPTLHQIERSRTVARGILRGV